MKRLKHLLIMVSLVSFAAPGNALAYEPAVQWQKTFGGSNYDEGYSVQQTSDDGYIIAGWTRSFGTGSGDVYLIKTDPNGNQEWQKTFGGSGGDEARSVQQTSDGGFIIAGLTFSFGAGESDVYLIKTDSKGNLLWQKTFGGSDWDVGSSVQQTTDGDFIIAGYMWSFWPVLPGDFDVYLIKTDSEGNPIRRKTFGGSYDDWGNSVQQTSDGGFIIAGQTKSFDDLSGDVYLVKTDPNGNLLWQKTFGRRYSDEGCSVQQTTDGGFIIAGTTYSFGSGSSDVYLIKTDSEGNLQWQKTFGGIDDDYGNSVQQTSDGGYVIAGTTETSSAGGPDVYLIKLSAEVCQYELFGDVNKDCKFDFYDFAIMAANWLIDCNIEPSDPACILK